MDDLNSTMKMVSELESFCAPSFGGFIDEFYHDGVKHEMITHRRPHSWGEGTSYSLTKRGLSLRDQVEDEIEMNILTKNE